MKPLDLSAPPAMSRRTFLRGLSLLLASAGLPACGDEAMSEDDPLGLSSSPAPSAPSLDTEPFRLGVASGDPLHDRVVIWTRLAPDPLDADARFGMPDDPVPVIWEVFADEALDQPVRSGWAWARPELAHSVHVDVDRLEPDTRYWYRFRVGDLWTSPTGRTRTFAAPDVHPERFVAALACCQKYRDGFYTAHRHLAEQDVHAVFFLGDYIYESGNETDIPGRLPIDTERVVDLPGFRERYGGYRMDPDLQEAHRVHPWIVIWDDHEVSNNYADLELADNRKDDGDPLVIRRAGYQSWYEHMPVRLEPPEDFLHLPIYRAFSFGDLANVFALDTRQYRSNQVCGDRIGQCRREPLDPELTMLGPDQKAWLLDGLARTDSLWNILAQQVVFGPVHNRFTFLNPDQWDGYMRARQEVLDAIAAPGVRNPIVFSGDVHAAGFLPLRADAADGESEIIGFEVLTTSISSGGDDADGDARLGPVVERLIDDVQFFDAAHRGYAICDFDRERLVATWWAVDTVAEPTSDAYVRRRFEIRANALAFEETTDYEEGAGREG